MRIGSEPIQYRLSPTQRKRIICQQGSLIFLKTNRLSEKCMSQPKLTGIHPNPDLGLGEWLSKCDRSRIAFSATENGLLPR